MTDKETSVAAIFVLQNEAKNIPNQDFVTMNLSCKFEISTYNTLCYRGPTKLLAESRETTCGGHLVLNTTSVIF